ncbi:MAG: hypothetical protein ACRCW1_03390 [Anaerotignaceae bacterium]
MATYKGSFMLRLLLLSLTLLLLLACGKAKFYTPTSQALQCTTNELNGFINVSCPNGVSYSFLAPQNGTNGLDGADGINGQDGLDAQQIKVIDPCGDFVNAVDEVLLVFPDKTVIAWYKNVGMVVLQPGIQYQTTDAQQCRFSVDSEGNVL